MEEENMSTSNSYAFAVDSLLSDTEKYELVVKLNETLPSHLKLMKNGVAITPEAFLEALGNSYLQLSRIMLSSGYNPWIGGKEDGISSFENFLAIYQTLSTWYDKYKEQFEKHNMI